MSYGGSSKGVHPGIGTLALYSNGDLPSFARWRLSHHIAACSECERQVALFRSAKTELKREAAAETLTGFEAIADWSRLEREMIGNIGVGVAAARCVDKVRSGRALGLRSVAVAGLAALFVAGWLTHIPREQTEHMLASLREIAGIDRQAQTETVVRTMPEGIAVRARGVTLMMMHPASAVVSLSGSSAVEARYIDEDTGQITITNVYGQ